jgi:hypothetical protein
MTRMEFILAPEDEAALTTLRDHLVSSIPFVTKADVLRTALREAAQRRETLPITNPR